MESIQFYIVDVFAEQKFAGNQLAVFMNAGALTDSQMQAIAKEMNYSETTFIISDQKSKGGYDVRIFTPAEEIPFAGHPTLGTTYIIADKIIQKNIKSVNLNLKVGQIPVELNYSKNKINRLQMKQINPVFFENLDRRRLAEILNINSDDIEADFPIQEVSTGLPFIIVPLKNLNAVKRSNINRVLFLDLIKNTTAKTILVFCPETYHPENQLNARVFCDYFSIPEDPATGSAAGCLTGYLIKHRYFGKDSIEIRMEQGYEIGRPSLLYLKGEQKKENIDIYVGGKVQMIAKGELYI